MDRWLALDERGECLLTGLVCRLIDGRNRRFDETTRLVVKPEPVSRYQIFLILLDNCLLNC